MKSHNQFHHNNPSPACVEATTEHQLLAAKTLKDVMLTKAAVLKARQVVGFAICSLADQVLSCADLLHGPKPMSGQSVKTSFFARLLAFSSSRFRLVAFLASGLSKLSGVAPFQVNG